MLNSKFILALALAGSPVPAFGAVQLDQAGSQPTAIGAETVAKVPDAAPCADCVTIPALTPVRLQILRDLGSKTSIGGESFPITLAEPIVIDGRVLIPAGATGVGEVVHAKRAGGSGAPGELILAARYLESGNRRVRLRSMHIAKTGESKIDTASTIAIAGGAAVPGLAIVGFIMKGGESSVPAGTFADAKTAEAISITAIDPVVESPATENEGKKE